jgi:hypothetical protein
MRDIFKQNYLGYALGFDTGNGETEGFSTICKLSNVDGHLTEAEFAEYAETVTAALEKLIGCSVGVRPLTLNLGTIGA